MSIECQWGHIYQILKLDFLNDNGLIQHCIRPIYFHKIPTSDELNARYQMVFAEIKEKFGIISDNMTVISEGRLVGDRVEEELAVRQFSNHLHVRLACLSQASAAYFFFGVDPGIIEALVRRIIEKYRQLWHSYSQNNYFYKAQYKQASVQFGKIYLIKQNYKDNLIKIGFTVNPTERLRKIRKNALLNFSRHSVSKLKLKKNSKVEDNWSNIQTEKQIEQQHFVRLSESTRFEFVILRNIIYPYYIEQYLHEIIAHHSSQAICHFQMSSEWFNIDGILAERLVNEILDKYENWVDCHHAFGLVTK